jgi:RNA polymerase sigma factor (sigma-70 family)
VLIARIRAGDTAAYETLYERHLGAARSLARQLANGDAAEDAVQDTFADILEAIQRGGGPRNGFRPYLLTAVRRTVRERPRDERRLQPTDRLAQYDPGLPFVDPALEGLELSMVVRAFQSLPERWQAVLWHIEIEEAKPADVAPLLGLSTNGLAALAYRAREGLRQAYLQMHLAAASDAQAETGTVTPVVDERCRPFLEKLGSYMRGGLAKRQSRSVERHLDNCADCKDIHAELVDIDTSLRDAVGPFILGTAATAYIASQGSVPAGGLSDWFRNLPRRRQQSLSAVSSAVAVAAAVLAMTLVSADHSVRPAPPPPPVAVQAGPNDPKALGARPQPRPQPSVPSPAPRSPRVLPVA